MTDSNGADSNSRAANDRPCSGRHGRLVSGEVCSCVKFQCLLIRARKQLPHQNDKTTNLDCDTSPERVRLPHRSASVPGVLFIQFPLIPYLLASRSHLHCNDSTVCTWRGFLKTYSWDSQEEWDTSADAPKNPLSCQWEFKFNEASCTHERWGHLVNLWCE